MNITNSPNMNLPVPVVSTDPGPDWATNINACLGIVDGHNHSAGSGVQIQPNGLNISSDLPFNGNNAINLRSTRFNPQGSPIANAGLDVGCLYVSGNELYYNDVTGSHQIPITSNGSVAGSTGTITGLPSGTASASFGGGVFTFKSSSTSNANIVMQSAVLSNNGNLTNLLTLQAPTLAASTSQTLPQTPAATNFMQMDSSGNMSASIAVSGGLTTSNLNASAGILGSQLSASANILGSQLSTTAGIIGTQIDPNAAIAPSQNDSTGFYNAATIASYSSTNTTTTFVASVVISNIPTTSRPMLISFYGGTINLSTAGSTGTSIATFQIYQVNTITSAKALRNSVIIPNGSTSYPGSVLTTILPPGTFNQNLEVALYAFVTNTGGLVGTASISNLNMSMMQV